MNLLLAIDVGNTHITIGAFDGKKLTHTWRLRTDRHATADELGLQLTGLLALARCAPCDLEGVCIGSVVPLLDAPLAKVTREVLGCEPVVITSRSRLGIRNLYKNPDEVGTDRLVNAVAVHARIKGAVIVVDFGTATTFDCVSARGDYLGGAICPGLELAGEWLATHTAKLPRVTFQVAPATALGKTTRESLQSGLFWGYIGLVEGLLTRLSAEMTSRPTVVVTGGLSPVIGPHLRRAPKIIPELTLEGLRLLWVINRPASVIPR